MAVTSDRCDPDDRIPVLYEKEDTESLTVKFKKEQRMFKRKWYEWLLTIVYVLMIMLCIYLNLDMIRTFMSSGDINITTLVVNAILFVIVAIVFLMADFGSFMPMNAIISDLKNATAKIRSDAMNSRSYLWEPYQ